MASADGTFEALECPICYELLSNPHALECGHSFCGPPKNCLKGLQHPGFIKCAVCNSEYRKTVDDLKPLYGIRDGLKSLSKKDRTKTSTSLPLCHATENGKFWCIECDCPVCQTCIQSDESTHSSHNFKKTSSILKDKIEPLLKKYQEVLTGREKVEQAIAGCMSEIQYQQQRVEKLKETLELLPKTPDSIHPADPPGTNLSFEQIKNDTEFLFQLLQFRNSTIRIPDEILNKVTVPVEFTATLSDIPSLTERKVTDVYCAKVAGIQYHIKATWEADGYYLGLYLTWNSLGPIKEEESQKIKFKITLINKKAKMTITKDSRAILSHQKTGVGRKDFIRWSDLVNESNGWLHSPNQSIVVSCHIAKDSH